MPLASNLRPDASADLPARPLSFGEALQLLGALPGVVVPMRGAFSDFPRATASWLWRTFERIFPGPARVLHRAPQAITVELRPPRGPSSTELLGETTIFGSRRPPGMPAMIITIDPRLTPPMGVTTLLHEAQHAARALAQRSWPEGEALAVQSRAIPEVMRARGVPGAVRAAFWREPDPEERIVRLLTDFLATVPAARAQHPLTVVPYGSIWARWMPTFPRYVPTAGGLAPSAIQAFDRPGWLQWFAYQGLPRELSASPEVGTLDQLVRATRRTPFIAWE